MSERQTSLRETLVFDGVGVHSGAPARLFIHPADAHSGIVFHRSDLAGDAFAPALWSNVCATELCTALRFGGAQSVSTIEHVSAALAGLGVDNALIEIDGPEAPILDGSAAAFVAAIDEAGVRSLPAARRSIEILKPVRVQRGAAFAELLPHAAGFALDVEIRFDHDAIGVQRKTLALTPDVFRRELARARTFGFLADVERLWQAGFALGASLDNTIAIGDAGVVNAEGLRFSDECVRHKMLDAVGDLALAGAPILGLFRSRCGGHALNYSVLRALFADRSAWRLNEPSSLRRGSIRPSLGEGHAPALAPDRS